MDTISSRPQTASTTATKTPVGKSPAKVTAKAPKGKKTKGGVRKREVHKEAFSSHLYKILKDVHPNTDISIRTMSILNSFINDIFVYIASETFKLAAYKEDSTITSREVQTAIRLLLPEKLAKHAISEGAKAVTKYAIPVFAGVLYTEKITNCINEVHYISGIVHRHLQFVSPIIETRTTAKFAARSNAFQGFFARGLTTAEKASNTTKGAFSKFAELRKPIVYNAKVLKELAKEVYIKENLRPPNQSQISEAWEALKSLKWSYIKNASVKDIKIFGVRSLECLGFFAIGEVIGRRSLIGYN
ncbi:2241_t:CDS:2 [Acaulospora morrowiae]|uniref:2241_t:CDS:1 n=1 Tax=Acaulospora morrowiae TaxID=94023 RepID=A0A9N8VEI7_9GLOM|nr:2241_t:CDS:2 [Acaulospora morrowiae]